MHTHICIYVYMCVCICMCVSRKVMNGITKGLKQALQKTDFNLLLNVAWQWEAVPKAGILERSWALGPRTSSYHPDPPYLHRRTSGS